MSHRWFAMMSASAFLVLLAGEAALAQPAAPSDPKASEQQAMAALKRMTEFLGQSRRFSVMLDLGFDVVPRLVRPCGSS